MWFKRKPAQVTPEVRQALQDMAIQQAHKEQAVIENKHQSQRLNNLLEDDTLTVEIWKAAGGHITLKHGVANK